MTVQFPQIDTAEPRLLPDSCKQTSSDQSFEEKLKFEQARLGLLFSPLARLNSLFSSTFYGGIGTAQTQPKEDIYSLLEQPSSSALRASEDRHPTSPVPSPSPKMFESIPLQSSNRQFLQQLLSQTGWLVPNLEAQPAFYNAFLEGKLQPKLDLQLLIDRIVEQVKLVKGKEKTELSLTLKPEELGEIFLVLSSHSGIVSISIQASPETKKLIDDQREELERALKRAQVSFDKIEIEEVKKYA